MPTLHPCADPDVHTDVTAALRRFWLRPVGPADHCHECVHGTAVAHVAATFPQLHAELAEADFTWLVNECEDKALASL